ncbi:MAG: peptidoglycan-binding protein [Ekhidna sp.]
MKKLLLGIIIIGLPLIIFFQYKNYKRFNPPADYEYVLSEAIDINYHNSALVDEYFQKGIEVGSFARLKWSNESIDVRFPDQNSEVELNAAKYYNQTLSRLKYLEMKLSYSATLKSKGMNNEGVIAVESGVPEAEVKFLNDKDDFLNLKLGNRGPLVWELQKRLNAHGYEHELDGVFGIATRDALLKFQNDNNLYPSGDMDIDVYNSILLN